MSKKIKIAHIADTHIRGLQRHAEMRIIFDAFMKDCKDKNVDYIFIAGDVWHTKTMGISPEGIDFMSTIFRELAAIAPLHMMLGNHDMNCVNLTRQDVISPLVRALNNKDIVLYKDSGSYEFHPGACFNIFSLYDEEKWEKVKPVEDKYNIACFHGSVRGALLESDWAMTEGMTVDYFKDYDLTLLGDIHRQQFLGERTYDNKHKVPWIGYPGSMAQQNFAEALEHGYLLWEIDLDESLHTVNFHKLPNPFPFVTIEWQGNVPKTLKEAAEFPDGARFRIRSSTAIMQRDVGMLIADLKHKRNATEVTFKIDESINRDTIQAGNVTIARDDLRNTEVIMELMREYYELEQITEGEWAKMQVLVDEYLRAIHAEDPKNIKWSLKKLDWSNTFIYGENNSINFEKLSGITGLFAPNRTGKSSVVGTLMYALFNSTDRGSLKNLHIINERKDYCRASATVSVNGTDYFFERQTAKMENKKGPFGVTSLNAFKLLPDGTKEELNGEQRNDTDKFIKSLIGTGEDFLITSVSAQDNLKSYINHGATHRKQIVSRFLDLDIFERIYDIANKAAAATRSLHKSVTVREWAQEIDKCKVEIKRLEDRSAEIETLLPGLRTELSEGQTELDSLAVVQPVTPQQLKAKQLEVENNVKLIASKEQSIASTRESLEAKQAMLAKCIAACEKADIKTWRANKAILDSLVTDNRIKNFKLKEEQTKLATMERSVKKLTTVPCGDSFPTCPFIKDSHEAKLTIDEQRAIVTSLSTECDEISVSIEALGDPATSISKYESVLQTQAKLQQDVSALTVNLLTFENELAKAVLASTQLNISLVDMEKAFQDEQNQRKMTVRIEVDLLQDSIREFESELRKTGQFVGRQQSLIETYENDKTKFEKLDAELRIHELVTAAFSKRGVPNRVIHSQLPIINSQINKLLHGIVNFTIKLESEVETNALEVYINYGEKQRIIELASGMEKVIASLALRAALTIITTLPKSDIFVIDEGFADLDETGVEICNRLVKSFKSYFRNIIIITHLDGIKEMADNLIEIARVDGDSKVLND